MADVCEAIPNDPSIINGDPRLAAGSWPMLPTDSASPVCLEQNEYVLWRFSDDKAACSESEDCMHVVEYQVVGDATGDWTTLPLTSDDDLGHAYTTLLIVSDSLAAGTYMFHFDVTDCADQRTRPSSVYYFKVE